MIFHCAKLHLSKTENSKLWGAPSPGGGRWGSPVGGGEGELFV
jgi:hypothetical protein